MAKGYNLGDIRAAIDDINEEIMSKRGDGEAPNSDVLTRLKETRPSLVTAFAPQLIDIALTKLLNEVCRRKAVRQSPGSQFDLFGIYSNIPKSVTISKGVKKSTEELTIPEAEDWLRSHSKRIIDSGSDDFQRLIDDCRGISTSETDTIAQILDRKYTGAVVQKEMQLAD